MKPGSKYYPLYQALQQRSNTAKSGPVQFSFAELEQLLNAKLPASDRRQKAWWSNRDSDRALQAQAWIKAGFQVQNIDLTEEQVTFHPFQAQYNVQRSSEGQIRWNQDAIKALRKTMGLTQAKFATELGVRRQTVSEWENGVYEPDRSTSTHLGRIADTEDFET